MLKLFSLYQFIALLFLFISCNKGEGLQFNGFVDKKSGYIESSGEQNFGEVAAGESYQVLKTLTNKGDFNITIKSISRLIDFTLNESSSCAEGVILEPDESCALLLDFLPVRLGTFSEVLEINYYDGIEKNKTYSLSLNAESIEQDLLDSMFVTTWDTRNTSDGSSNSNQITLPLVESKNYFFTVNWGDGEYDLITSWDDSDKTHTYTSSGLYTIKISFGTDTILDAFEFRFTGDRLKLLSVENWGDLKVDTMYMAFSGCANLEINAIDAPDLSNVTSMLEMFRGATSMNQDISHWDTSNVTNMSGLFYQAENFNQDISEWDTSNVTDMSYLFANTNFNQDISLWDTSNVTDMSYIFGYAPLFNQDLSSWDVSNVTNTFHFDVGADSCDSGNKPSFPP